MEKIFVGGDFKSDGGANMLLRLGYERWTQVCIQVLHSHTFFQNSRHGDFVIVSTWIQGYNLFNCHWAFT